MKKPYSFKNYISIVVLLLALVIIIDFIVPGKTNNEIIIGIKKNYEQYYNAGNNHHYSYKIKTTNREFTVSESFAKQVLKNDEVSYKTSLIFNEVNSYFTETITKSTLSLRYMTGLFIPIFAVLVVLFSLFSKKNIDILLFVTFTLLTSDLVFLII